MRSAIVLVVASLLPAQDTRAIWAAAPLPEPGTISIDARIAEQQREHGLAPRPRADPATLLRRVTFDLTGLPPAPEEVRAFVTDQRPDAFARVIDRLLASPRYGEKQARHWLDLARYADTAGDSSDYPIEDAWRYRNWVIRALNEDLPYDEFVRQQIAGDLLAKDAPEAARAGMIVATGFLALARRFGVEKHQDRHLVIEDTIDTVTRTTLALTVRCARCHDHKFDPISMRDYYALYGIFRSTEYPHPGSENQKRPEGLVEIAPGASAYAVREGKPADAALQRQGEPSRKGDVVPRAFLAAIDGAHAPELSGSGRIELASWLVRGSALPLAARVQVNRVWQQHFGRGLVATPGNFGALGGRPSHPELLDELAARFVASGWSQKELHKTILLTDAWQRASGDDARDPDNVWLARMRPRRLEAEEIRDTILMVAGALDLTPGAAHPFPPREKWGFTQHDPFRATSYESDKRSVYLMTQRIVPQPFLALFDGADANQCTELRSVSTTPTQALFLRNDPWVHRQARRFAERLVREQSGDRERITRAHELAFARAPRAGEGERAWRYLQRAQARGADPLEAWSSFARVLLATHELVHVE